MHSESPDWHRGAVGIQTLDIFARPCKTEIMDVEDQTQRSRRGDLRAVVVRPVEDDEEPRWLELMRAHHYLGFGKSQGKRIFYVATLDGQWVALLSWAAAALHVKCRDNWIGWDSVAKRHRLCHVTNNTRFLILPGATVKNLASRVLALNLKRLRADWLYRHGQQIHLVETFVDPERFRGTCYLAQGWTFLGLTEGFGKDPSGAYTAHGKPKMMFVRPLIHDVQYRLRNPIIDDDRAPRLMLDIRKLRLDGKGGLLDVMRTIPSVRVKECSCYRQYKLLGLMTCALLSGARNHVQISRYVQSLTAAELGRVGLGPADRPSRWTLWRLLNRIDSEQFDREVSRWLASASHGHTKTKVKEALSGNATLPLLTAFRRDCQV